MTTSLNSNSTSSLSFMSIYRKHKKRKIWPVKLLVFGCSALTFATFLTVVGYVIFNGISTISLNFFKINSSCSILPEIVNTIYVVFISILFAVPVALSTSIFLTQFSTNKKFIKLVSFSTEILASVPSILFGMFGYYLFCIFFSLKCSILSGSLTMAVCVLPIIVQTTTQAILNVPKSFSHAALALGASKLRTIFSIIIPCSASGILTGTILAIGKIIGESAALLLTTGTGTKLPSNLFNHIFASGQTLSLHLYFVSGNSSSLNSMQTCFATATVLLALTFILNCIAKFFAKKFAK